MAEQVHTRSTYFVLAFSTMKPKSADIFFFLLVVDGEGISEAAQSVFKVIKEHPLIFSFFLFFFLLGCYV